MEGEKTNFTMYSQKPGLWMPEESRQTEKSSGGDEEHMLCREHLMQTTEEVFGMTKTVQAPFQEKLYKSTAVIREDSSIAARCNPNVIHTTRPVFKYTCPPRPKNAGPARTKHPSEIWRNSAPLNNLTNLETFTVGKYYRNHKVGKSAVSMREVDGRFIPTPPGGGSMSGITQWSRWYEYF